MIDISDEARAVAKLSAEQRKVLALARPLMDGRVLVPAHVKMKRWPPYMVDTYSVAMRRLTPFGLEVQRAILAAESEVGR